MRKKFSGPLMLVSVPISSCWQDVSSVSPRCGKLGNKGQNLCHGCFNTDSTSLLCSAASIKEIIQDEGKMEDGTVVNLGYASL